MTEKQIVFIILIIWSIPSTYFRSKFRKIVYQTDDWKINIKPLFSNMYPDNKEYLKTRNYYQIYLAAYLILFITYQLI